MQAQLDRWLALHPTFPKNGKVFEVPASYLLPRMLAMAGLAGAIWYFVPHMLWNQKPATLDPDFVAEAKRIGNVAQRVNGPPVFLNPFRHRIPGNILGPEDLKKELDS